MILLFRSGNRWLNTNQFAELEAIYAALKIAKRRLVFHGVLNNPIKHRFRRWSRIEIRTDSSYAIKAIREYAPKWRDNADENGNWYNSKGKNSYHKMIPLRKC